MWENRTTRYRRSSCCSRAQYSHLYLLKNTREELTGCQHLTHPVGKDNHPTGLRGARIETVIISCNRNHNRSDPRTTPPHCQITITTAPLTTPLPSSPPINYANEPSDSPLRHTTCRASSPSKFELIAH
ncbi:hypothetical protein J6590_051874 [Homalodisca vitripennis]|nr:hypothetical protein J6590_051874 [Homalodisca vitripennis]